MFDAARLETEKNKGVGTDCQSSGVPPSMFSPQWAKDVVPVAFVRDVLPKGTARMGRVMRPTPQSSE